MNVDIELLTKEITDLAVESYNKGLQDGLTSAIEAAKLVSSLPVLIEALEMLKKII